MKGWTLSLIIAAAVIVIVVASRERFTQVRPSGAIRAWNVAGGANAGEAAQALDRVNTRMISFMRHLARKYHIDEPDDVIAAEGEVHTHAVRAPGDLYAIVGALLNGYNPDVFYENAMPGKDTSYTIRKGDAMYLCLRDRVTGAVIDDDTLFFVLLHESAHIANYKGWGHASGFWSIFKFLLGEAAAGGHYKPVDYAKHPVNYCGLNLNWNPLFDDSVVPPR